MVKLQIRENGKGSIHIPTPIYKALGWDNETKLNLCVRGDRLTITALKPMEG